MNAGAREMGVQPDCSTQRKSMERKKQMQINKKKRRTDLVTQTLPYPTPPPQSSTAAVVGGPQYDFGNYCDFAVAPFQTQVLTFSSSDNTFVFEGLLNSGGLILRAPASFQWGGLGASSGASGRGGGRHGRGPGQTVASRWGKKSRNFTQIEKNRISKPFGFKK